MSNIAIDLETGKPILFLGGGNGGGSSEQVALLSITTAPASPFAVGSKYYNSTDKKIYTAITANTWTGATSADPVFNTIYTFDGEYYIWDGDSLESTDLNLYEKVANKTDSYTETSPTKYPSSKALSDGLASVGSSSIVPFSVKSSNVDSNELTDLVSMNEIINVGCSVTSGVATGASEKYLQLVKTAPIASADSWEIKIKYKYIGGSGDGGTAILGSSTTVDNQVPMLIVGIGGGNNLHFIASSTGTSWDLFAQDTGWTLSSGTTYWIILSYDSVTGYKIEYSTNGTDYTTAWSSATVTKCYCSKPFIFLNNMLNLTTYSPGSIDLNETVITIDSVVWFSYSETLRFKIDDGTLYAPLTIVSADGTETALTTVSDLDLSSFADGRINIFFGVSGAVAYNNTIFNQTNQPTPNATNDIWFNNLNEAKKWSGSAWETTDLVFGLYVIKNGVLETYGNVPLNYNGKGEVLAKSYNSTTENYDIYVRPNFNFYCVQYGLNTENNVIIYIYPMYDTNYNLLTATKVIPYNRMSLYSQEGNNGGTYWRVEGYVVK